MSANPFAIELLDVHQPIDRQKGRPIPPMRGFIVESIGYGMVSLVDVAEPNQAKKKRLLMTFDAARGPQRDSDAPPIELPNIGFEPEDVFRADQLLLPLIEQFTRDTLL